MDKKITDEFYKSLRIPKPQNLGPSEKESYRPVIISLGPPPTIGSIMSDMAIHHPVLPQWIKDTPNFPNNLNGSKEEKEEEKVEWIQHKLTPEQEAMFDELREHRNRIMMLPRHTGKTAMLKDWQSKYVAGCDPIDESATPRIIKKHF